MYAKFGKPGVWNKERVWLAVDHTVDPRNYSDPKPAALIKLSDDFVQVRWCQQCPSQLPRRLWRLSCIASHRYTMSAHCTGSCVQETEITDYWPKNETIMHTEFARQRAQPGQIVIGADSHTCSAGGMGAFACGLGAADVAVPLVTGQTWFQVPETVLIEFVGKPGFGIGGESRDVHCYGSTQSFRVGHGHCNPCITHDVSLVQCTHAGKDVILHVLGTLKRNTVALDRAVEFRGPGLAYLSSDARFAIANMVRARHCCRPADSKSLTVSTRFALLNSRTHSRWDADY